MTYPDNVCAGLYCSIPLQASGAFLALLFSLFARPTLKWCAEAGGHAGQGALLILRQSHDSA
jgi:hypothetical protein